MALNSTFGGFTAARLGVYAAQYGLNLTANNTSNVNTVGYTRQTLKQASFRAGSGDMYASKYSISIGNGVLCSGVSQIRDPYLDLRYRNENANVGAMSTRQTVLDSLGAIFDEVGLGNGDGVIEKQISNLMQQLQNLSSNAGQDEFDTLVRSSATTLVQLFNNYSSQLDDVENNLVNSFQQDITTVNNILENIRDLNSAIRKADIHGDSALELRDSRNVLIDELSGYIKLDVTYSTEDIGDGFTVEKLNIKVGSGDYDKRATLVDGVFCTQLSTAMNNTGADKADKPYLMEDGTSTAEADLAATDPLYRITLAPMENTRGIVMDGSEVVQLGDDALYGALQSSREMLTREGEFYTDALREDKSTSRGIPYYRNALDALANRLATVLNDANTGYVSNEKGEYVDENGNVLQYGGNPLSASALDALGDTDLVNAENILKAANQQLKAKMSNLRSGALFTNGTADPTEPITAKNITISSDWANGTVRIQNSFEWASGTSGIASQANSNIIHMLTQFDTKFNYTTNAVLGAEAKLTTPYFNGTFQEMLTSISATLGNDMNTTSTMLENYTSSSTELDASRDSVSSVDLNDEAVNLIQFQKAYSAACRVMTTLDEALDKLINGTGSVGR